MDELRDHPERQPILVEEKCAKCIDAEKKINSDSPAGSSLLTKKELRRLEASLYKKMVDDGFLHRLVDKLATFCPKKAQDLSAYAQLLVFPKSGEAVDRNSRYNSVVKLDETIRNVVFSKENETPLESRLDAIAKEIHEETRQRRRKPPTQPSDVKSVKIREHVCNKGCPWCQLHCENMSTANQKEGTKCNNNCVIIERNHQC
ncbi:Hypothetical protein NTJ_12954 [Nesidiocoris tenuis]|uniref:Uncharacterized protein n=1 Tax=Nesidiocoris tenuis TaxID=355587 RepID=A0ABN7B6W0_9HEMI|nr:Hypothetical protein NTJ_12954 [Nesidiocoris tenuis]